MKASNQKPNWTTENDFTDVLFDRAVLKNCTITGTFTNIVFYGKKAPAGWRTRFDRVDLSGVKLIDTDFRVVVRQNVAGNQ
jgi:uncharacterized protein YjbI with pentapeptide repeats